MPITPGIITIAADVPNPTFSRPSDLNNIPASWTADAGVTQTAIYSATDLPAFSHQRAQRYSVTKSGGGAVEKFVTGSIVTPGKFCANVATEFLAAVWNKNTGLDANHTLDFQIAWFDSAGTILGSGYVNLLNFLSAASWTVQTNEIARTPPASAHHCRIRLRFNLVTDGTITVDLAFMGFGSYDGTNGSHTLARDWSIGTSARPVEGSRRRIITALNLPTWIDRDRYSQPFAGQLVVSGVPTAMRDALQYVWNMNHGRSWEAAAVNPAGGQYPFILIGNGIPTLPAAGLYDFDGGEDFPLDAAPVGWLPETPDWSGTLPIRERL